MRYFSVCSGVDAASLAWEYLGWEPVAFSEVEPFPCAVLKSRWPKVPNLGDLTKIHILENGDIQYATTSIIPNDGKPIDVLVGGSPCQDASSAGKREGLIKGTRSSLAFTYARLAYELAAFRGLRYFVWENVPGVFSLNGGWDFAAFLSSLSGQEITPPKRNGWKNFGIVRNPTEGNFGLCWRVLDVRYCRVDGFPKAIPQRRRRIFLVGYLGDWRRAAEILFEQQSLLGNHPPQRNSRQGMSSSPCGGSCGDDRADGDTGGVDDEDSEGRCQGTEGHAAGEGSGDFQERCGSLIPYGMRLGAREDGTVATITRIDVKFPQCVYGDERTFGRARTPIAFEPGIARREGDPNRFVDGVSPTLRAVMGDNLPAVAQETPIGFLLNDMGGGVMQLEKGDVSPTLRREMKGHEPIIMNDNTPSSESTSITGFRESSFGGYVESEDGAAQKASRGSAGGGSETFVASEIKS